ncbi:TPA: hypothetical protein ACVBYD_000689 [Yersinia enterocolitica]
MAFLFLLVGNVFDGVSPIWQYLPLLNPLEEGAGANYVGCLSGVNIRNTLPC